MSRRRALLAGASLLLASLIAAIALDLRRLPPTTERLRALRSERDALERRLLEQLSAAGEASFAAAPRGEVVVGLPNAVMAALLARAIVAVFGETRIVLENVHTRAGGRAEADVLFKKRTVGRWELDVRIRHMEALLRPSTPTVDFVEKGVAVEVPLSLEEGTGDVDLRLHWDSKGVAANLVCGDEDVTRRLAGSVLPRRYRLQGQFSFEASGDALVLRPQSLTPSVRLFVAPAPAAWDVLDQVLDQQRLGCEIALGKANVRGQLADLLARGFEVKLPEHLLRPIAIPVATAPLDYAGARYRARISPGSVVVAPDRLWTAAAVTVLESSPITSDAAH